MQRVTRSRSKSQQHVLWQPMTMQHLIIKAFECQWEVLNRMSPIETPLSPWHGKKKSCRCSLSSLPSQAIWPLKLRLLHMLSTNLPENRPCCFPLVQLRKRPGTVSITKCDMILAAVRLFSESSAMEWVWLWAQRDTVNICFKEKQ